MAFIDHRVDGVVVGQIEVPDPPAKTSGLAYDEFRKLFTIAELTLLDSYDHDDYFQAMGFAPLTVVQKANVRFLISEAKATGSGPIGINVQSPKMATALAALMSYGAISNERRLEILAGIQKS